MEWWAKKWAKEGRGAGIPERWLVWKLGKIREHFTRERKQLDGHRPPVQFIYACCQGFVDDMGVKIKSAIQHVFDHPQELVVDSPVLIIERRDGAAWAVEGEGLWLEVESVE